MTWVEIADLASLVCLLVGAVLALIAAIGLVTFPDLLTRMHSATKPQVVGLLFLLLGLGLRLRDPSAIGMLVLIALAQLSTAPISAHLVARAAARTQQVRPELLTTDELSSTMTPAPAEGAVPGGYQAEPEVEAPDPEDDVLR